MNSSWGPEIYSFTIMDGFSLSVWEHNLWTFATLLETCTCRFWNFETLNYSYETVSRRVWLYIGKNHQNYGLCVQKQRAELTAELPYRVTFIKGYARSLFLDANLIWCTGWYVSIQSDVVFLCLQYIYWFTDYIEMKAVCQVLSCL